MPLGARETFGNICWHMLSPIPRFPPRPRQVLCAKIPRMASARHAGSKGGGVVEAGSDYVCPCVACVHASHAHAPMCRMRASCATCAPMWGTWRMRRSARNKNAPLQTESMPAGMKRAAQTAVIMAAVMREGPKQLRQATEDFRPASHICFLSVARERAYLFCSARGCPHHIFACGARGRPTPRRE